MSKPRFPWDINQPFLPQISLAIAFYLTLKALDWYPHVSQAARNLWDHGYFAGD